ncbi:hypothetical protein KCU81_g405, partial [Aureobasidium melanogenum]
MPSHPYAPRSSIGQKENRKAEQGTLAVAGRYEGMTKLSKHRCSTQPSLGAQGVGSKRQHHAERGCLIPVCPIVKSTSTVHITQKTKAVACTQNSWIYAQSIEKIAMHGICMKQDVNFSSNNDAKLDVNGSLGVNVLHDNATRLRSENPEVSESLQMNNVPIASACHDSGHSKRQNIDTPLDSRSRKFGIVEESILLGYCNERPENRNHLVSGSLITTTSEPQCKTPSKTSQNVENWYCQSDCNDCASSGFVNDMNEFDWSGADSNSQQTLQKIHAMKSTQITTFPDVNVTKSESCSNRPGQYPSVQQSVCSVKH